MQFLGFSCKWKQVPKIEASDDDAEFGQINLGTNIETFFIKFYTLNKGGQEEGTGKEVVCQLDCFVDVPLSEAQQCLDIITDSRILLQKVQIEIHTVDAKYKCKIEEVFDVYFNRRQMCAPGMVKRLVFFCYDFTYGVSFANCMAKIAPRVYEINIGIAKRKTAPLVPDNEADYVLEFLQNYIKNGGWETIRVIRLYCFIKLDRQLGKVLKSCIRLKHITFSFINEIALMEVPHVTSVLLDGCDAACTLYDFEFAEKVPRMFPAATVFGYLRCALEVAIKGLLQFSFQKVNDNRNSIDFYQPGSDFRRFLLEATKNFEVVNDDNELEGEIELIGHNGGPLVTVHNRDKTYFID
ncbi:unnamed protein product [Caenorhabditis bovis]|uniref:Uncharacterized protein n=1 Tax=Caenorhabditis bovis TaxID=2654633 RepID=A0A8S1FDM2_9PELO|nr:unnamed protein product [Caenorhabditis bovis]